MGLTPWDNQGLINASGNLSLGQQGRDDGSGDTAHAYAKRDCWIFFDILGLQPVVSNVTVTRTRTSAGLYNLVLTATGAATAFIPVLLPFPYRTLSGLVSQTPVAPHGFKVTRCRLNYAVATADATSLTVAAFTELQSNNGARAATATALGAVTYNNPLGTAVGTLPVAQQANPYVTEAIFGTPVFVTAAGTQLLLEVAVSAPNTSVVTLTQLGVQFSAALY